MNAPLFTLRSIVIASFYGLLIIGLLGYGIFQSRLLLEGPRITLIDPPATVRTEPWVYIEGTAENIVYIAINDHAIPTNERGYFKEALLLQAGYTIISIEARDRYGRTKQVTQEFVYTPDTDITDNNLTTYGSEESSQEST